MKNSSNPAAICPWKSSVEWGNKRHTSTDSSSGDGRVALNSCELRFSHVFLELPFHWKLPVTTPAEATLIWDRGRKGLARILFQPSSFRANWSRGRNLITLSRRDSLHQKTARHDARNENNSNQKRHVGTSASGLSYASALRVGLTSLFQVSVLWFWFNSLKRQHLSWQNYTQLTNCTFGQYFPFFRIILNNPGHLCGTGD